MEYIKVSENVYVMYPHHNSNLPMSASNTVPTTCIALPDELFLLIAAHTQIFHHNFVSIWKKSSRGKQITSFLLIYTGIIFSQ